MKRQLLICLMIPILSFGQGQAFKISGQIFASGADSIYLSQQFGTTFKNYIDLIYQNIDLKKLGLFLPTFENIKTIDYSRRPELIIWGMDTNFLTDGISRIKI